ncbi:MAG: radical SAM protein [Myxococcales bacterium]|nr:radical SAM protein [Myxococcales bacterium]
MHENALPKLEPHLHRTPASPAAPSLGEMAQLWKQNRSRLADDHLSGRTVATGRPAHMKIELTNYCNLACPMCPHEQMEREVGYMKPDLFKRIIDMSAPELEFAYLHHLGESLFHGKIGDLIRYGRSRGVAMGLSTNATYLDARKGRLLLENGLDFLVISMDGASPDTYARVRVGGDFATTVKNVRAFFEMKRQIPNHTTVVVQMIVTDANRAEVEPFAKLWAEDNAQVMIKEARDWAGQVKLYQLGKQVERPPVEHTPCKMLWTELTVLWDGAVVPCVNVYEKENVLGNLATQSLEEVWNGPLLRELREKHLADDVDGIPVCATCPRHGFDHPNFVAHDQLAQRLRNYIRTDRNDLAPRAGLS